MDNLDRNLCGRFLLDMLENNKNFTVEFAEKKLIFNKWVTRIGAFTN